ncbi:hypothetical protein K493DRAFT_195261, partial [Basidiobolus meristosporus CBS 931.73]
CELLDGFAILVQSLMALMAVSSLLVKRQRECPRRPGRVWLFDVSKQSGGAAMVHVLNLLVSSFAGSRSGSREDNPCVWYLLNLLLDTTVGVLILYFVLKGVHRILDHFQVKEMDCGNYGSPPECRIWLKQSLVFLLALSATKLTIFLGTTAFPCLVILGQWILDPIIQLGDPRLQVMVVMFILPMFLNMLQFWLVDSLIR